MDLHEWTRIFLKQKDLMRRRIRKLEESQEGFTIETKDGMEERVVVADPLTTDEASKEPDMIVCRNTKENVEELIKGWEDFAKPDHLTIVFANPDTNEKWLLKPHHHDKVADKKSLKQGLLSMHEAVTPA